MRYTEEAVRMILSAANQARNLGHSYVGTQHLLTALTQEPGWAGQILELSGLSGTFAQDALRAL